MKLDAVLALVKPFLAADAKPDEIKAAILAADKKAKDAEPKDPKAEDADPKDPKAEDKGAKDSDNTDPEATNCDEDIDAEDNDLTQAEPGTPSKGGASKRPAMDEATVAKIVAKAVAARDELHTAHAEVAPIVGARTFDSADSAYKAALEALRVDLTDVPESAYRAVLKLAKDRQPTLSPIAFDSANEAEVLKLIPNYNRL